MTTVASGSGSSSLFGSSAFGKGKEAAAGGGAADAPLAYELPW